MADRDYIAEVAAAGIAGDIEKLLTLAMKMAMIVEKDRDRREKEAERKRNRRARPVVSADNAGQDGTSVTNAVNPPAPSLPSLSSPTPLLNPSFPSPPPVAPATTLTARESSELNAYAVGIATAANLAILTKWGEQVIPLRWDTATQLAADLLALSVPLELTRSTIAGVVSKSKKSAPPKGLEYFRTPILEAHQNAEQREIDAKAQPAAVIGQLPSANGARGSGSAETGDGAALLIVGQIRELIESKIVPGHGQRRYIPRANVEELGADVLAAYEAIGGADRFLGATGEGWGFLTRDFRSALLAAQKRGSPPLARAAG